MVENLVAIELAYINTKHPDFHKDAALVPSLLKTDMMEPWTQANAIMNSMGHRRNPQQQQIASQRTASPHAPGMHGEGDRAEIMQVRI